MICNDSDHQYEFIKSSHLIGGPTHNYEIHVCSKCGQFRVRGYIEGQRIDIRFMLHGREVVDAASAYYRYTYRG